MSPIRIGPSFPPMVEAEAPTADKPQASVESAAQSASASSEEKQFIQPSAGDEVLIAFERGEERMPYLTGALWKEDTPPTSASSPTDGTSGGTPSSQPATEKRELLNDCEAKAISAYLKTPQ